MIGFINKLVKLASDRVSGDTWGQISLHEYASAYERLGGSIHFHPLLVGLIAEFSGASVSYYGLQKEGRLVAALPVMGELPGGVRETLLALGVEHRLDIGEGEVIIPLEPTVPVGLRWSFAMLSAVHAGEIKNICTMGNVAFMMARRHAIGEDRLSGKFLYNQRVQWRRFQDRGATVKAVECLAVDEIVEAYRNLHQLRWGCLPKGSEDLTRVFSVLKPLLFGHVLFVNAEPVGIDLMYAFPSARGILAVGVNGGTDPQYKESGVGSILHFLNGIELENMASRYDTGLRACYGKNDAGYKKLWCREEPAYFV